MKTETEERFEEILKEFEARLLKSKLTYEDGIELEAYAQNLLVRYQQIKKSRDKWKDKYQNLNKSWEEKWKNKQQ